MNISKPLPRVLIFLVFLSTATATAGELDLSISHTYTLNIDEYQQEDFHIEDFSKIESDPLFFSINQTKTDGNETAGQKNETDISEPLFLNYWTTYTTVGDRTFSGVKTLGGVFDPSISGNGKLVTIRSGIYGELVNINYNSPMSPIVRNVTPVNIYPPHDDVAFPMALSAYLNNGTYRSGMWGPLVKPGIVEIYPSANASNKFTIHTDFPNAGHTNDIDRWGENLAVMRRADDGSGYKHNVFVDRFYGVPENGHFSNRLLSHAYGSDMTNANSNSQYPRISGTGQFVVYESSSSNIVPVDTNFSKDIFVANTFDSQVNAFTRNELISRLPDGTQSNGSSNSADISEDGRYVAYSTTATNLVHQGVGGIILHDRLFNTNTLVSVNATGTPATSYGNPSISYDGRFIAFESSDNNLTSDAVTGKNAYVYDNSTGEIRLASYSLADGSYSITASRTQISANGRYLVFISGEYVYRVESPFNPGERGVLASILTDDRGPVLKLIDSSSSGPDSSFRFPVKLINTSNSTKTITLENHIYYRNGGQFFYSEWSPHEDFCRVYGEPHCSNGVPTFYIEPNESSPYYFDVTYPFFPHWPNTEYVSFNIITDVESGETTYLQMNFLKVR